MYIDRLLQGAPVEWLSLGEVGEICMCKRILKEQTSESGEIPFYKIGTFGGVANSYISRELFTEYRSKYRYPKVGDILISASGTIGRTVVFDGTDAYFQDSNIVWIDNDERLVTNRFLYYYYQVIQWSVAKGGTIQRLYNDAIKKAKIPIPPVAVQEEVVRILDKFTALEAELDCRKRQYQYYRDALLTFDLSPSDGLCHSPLFPAPFAVEWCPLGKVAEIKRGVRVTKKDLNPIYEYPVYSGGVTPMGYYQHFNQEANTITVVKYGTAGYVNFITERFWANDVCYCLKPTSLVSSRYLLHLLRDRQEYIYSLVTDAIPAHLPIDRLERVPIPIPPLAVQERIVEILDKFDTLVNSISEGLPREIELRRKQYEYYRDALLSFEPLTSNL